MKTTKETLLSPYRSRPCLSVAAGVLLVGQVAICQNAFADGGDFSFDFTAAAPLTYDHLTGGGAYNDRTVGRDKDIVESLEGGDFACGDIVTFLTQIRVDTSAFPGAQTVRLRFEYTAHATGQQGVALVDNPLLRGTSAAINGGGIDTGTVDDNGSTATVIDEVVDGTVFVKPTPFRRTIDVTDLEPGETVVLRTDVLLACNGDSPTGNMQARLGLVSVTEPASEAGDSRGGDQTIPFKQIGDIDICDPKVEVCPPPPK